jgi:hypothetical protein
MATERGNEAVGEKTEGRRVATHYNNLKNFFAQQTVNTNALN